jgi:transcriptional regulator GlxA family with amidase domain
VDDMVARPLTERRAVSGLLASYAQGLLDLDAGDYDDALAEHAGATIVDLIRLMLGAERDAAEIASMRGLRAARLQAVLAAIRAGFADPAFSSQVVANGLGLSRRYINDLLFESGWSFAERVMELRLQKARAMPSDRRHNKLKVSEIAYACGFNEVSYFNRCFRARFGASPTQFRGKDGPA